VAIGLWRGEELSFEVDGGDGRWDGGVAVQNEGRVRAGDVLGCDVARRETAPGRELPRPQRRGVCHWGVLLCRKWYVEAQKVRGVYGGAMRAELSWETRAPASHGYNCGNVYDIEYIRRYIALGHQRDARKRNVVTREKKQNAMSIEIQALVSELKK
jgi:hypothetical protein